MMAAALAFVLTFLLVGGYRHAALRYRWLDVPNHRSSHTLAVARGAGIVFAVVITVAALFSITTPPVAIGMVAVFAVALVGWWEDLRGVAARWRFALYSLAALAIAAGNLRWPENGSGLLVLLASTVLLVWLINLYNFMDGINGIAGFQALFIFAAALWLGRGSGYVQILGTSLSVALFAVAGFLCWNFPRARVFMGDAGSAYLGALIGACVLWSIRYDGPPLIAWLILLGVFIVDTGYTLAVRLVTGQRWYEAHRLHAYQRLTDRLGSHAKVVSVIGLINIGWLLPLAWVSREWGWAALGMAYAPLIVACYMLKAGLEAPATL